MNTCNKIGLGTVQWGMRYGVANRSGRPDANEVAQMLRLASESGITLLDTAKAYGDAETVIGQVVQDMYRWRVVTKIPAIHDENFGDPEAKVLSDAFHESRRRLNSPKVYGLLVHNAEDLLSASGIRLWEELQIFKAESLVSKVGVSVYEPDQLSRILDRFPIDLVQLPLNLYDQRFLREGLLARTKRSGVEVHVRSVFLQGLLLLPPNQLPGQFSGILAEHIRFYRECEHYGVTPLEASLRFCLTQSEVDQVIVGCEARQQLAGILHAASRSAPCLPAPESFAVDDFSLVDPRRWVA